MAEDVESDKATAGTGSVSLNPRRVSRRAFLAGGAALVGAGAAGGLAVGLLAGPLKGSNGAGSSLVGVEQATGAGGQPGLPPTFRMPVGNRRVEAAHLLRRAGFGGSRADIDTLAALSREEAVDYLMDTSMPDDVDEKLKELGVDVWNNPGDLQRSWLLRMVYTKRPLVERMAFFWHDHFATGFSKVKDPWLMDQHVQIFRDKGLGNFRDLVLAVAQDPAMLIWLDNRLNVKGKPNENYARELMELHTVGIGNYTEDDIKEAARAFTGWGLARRDQAEYRRQLAAIQQKLGQPGLSAEERRALQRQRQLLERDYPLEFRFNPRQHDYGNKTVMGHTGQFDGTDIIDMLVSQDACAEFIARKLFHYFVYDHPDGDVCSLVCDPRRGSAEDEAEESLIAHLKSVYFESGHEVAPMVRALFTSDVFYSDRAYRALVRSPVEFVVSAARVMEAHTDGRLLATVTRQMGQAVFDPPDPAGWPRGAAWVNGNAIIGRANFANALASARQSPAGRRPPANFIQPEKFLSGSNITEAGHVVDLFAELLLDGNISAADRNILIEYLHTADDGGYELFTLNDASVDKKVRGLIYLMLSSPLYQLS